jgi:hypothetical protein
MLWHQLFFNSSKPPCQPQNQPPRTTTGHPQQQHPQQQHPQQQQQQQQQQPGWTDTALAQAGLLLLLDCDFDRAFAALDRCHPAAFQPAQLLDLFPHHGQRWLGAAPRRAYWGLHGHGGLPNLHQLVEDWVELQLATAPRHGAGGSSGGGGQQGQAGGPSVDELVAAGTAAAAAYLGRARGRAGALLPEAVDTLLLHLLADSEDAAALEALVTRPNAVEPSEAAAALKGAGRWHALALMRACGGAVEEALGIWQVRGGCWMWFGTGAQQLIVTNRTNQLRQPTC